MIPEMTIAGYAVPVILTIIMALIYKFIPVISDRYKALITIGVAVVLAVVSMAYNVAEAITAKIVIEHVLGGIILGASAIGVYEGARTFLNPRS